MNFYPVPLLLDETDSTNDYCKNLLNTGRPDEFQAVVARFQSRGRGQTGAQWLSESSANLTVSYILYPAFLSPYNSFYLSVCVVLAVADVAEEAGVAAKVKWPNDIMAGRRKLAGILIENVFEGSRFASCVAGVGLNINQKVFPPTIKPATSLAGETGNIFETAVVLDKLTERLHHWYSLLRKQAYIRLHDAYLRKLYLRDEWHTFTTQQGKIDAKITDVLPTGELEVLVRDGARQHFMFKEIEYPVLT